MINLTRERHGQTPRGMAWGIHLSRTQRWAVPGHQLFPSAGGDTLDTLKCHKASRKIIQFREEVTCESSTAKKGEQPKGKGQKGEGNVSSLASRLEIATLEPYQDQEGHPLLRSPSPSLFLPSSMCFLVVF